MTAKIKTINKSASRVHKHKPKGVTSRDFEKVHWPYLPILMVIFILIGLLVQSTPLQAIVKNPNNKVLAYSTSMSVSGLLSSTNAARSGNGIASLTLNSKLNAAAQAKANDMASRNYWSHNTPEGNPPWIFVTAQGYSYQKLGENLATGFSNEQATIDGWMASPPHKANLLDSAFAEVGFGFANNPDYTSAGGGPMTIMVAFYGKPVGASETSPAAVATPSPTPPAAKKIIPIAPTPAPTPQPETQPTPVEPVTPQSSPPSSESSDKKIDLSQPVTTESKKSGVTLSYKTSRASLAFAQTPLSSFATGMAIFGIFAATGLWITKHALLIRKVWVKSEAYAFKHPLVDAGLIVIAGLSYLLAQTAGQIL